MTTSYVDMGEGSPIVLVHGGDPGRGSAGLLIWHRNLDGLAVSHRVVAVDRLGQGYTDNLVPADAICYKAICEHLVATLDHLGITRATVVGQSRGALVSVRVAMERPDLVAGLVLVNTASLVPELAARRRASLARFVGLPETVEDDEMRLSVGRSHITQEWVRTVSTMLSRPASVEARLALERSGDAYYRDVEATKSEALDWLGAGKLSVPSLVMWAAGDPSVSVQQGLDLFEHIRLGSGCARMYIVDGAGHHCFAEIPREFNEAVGRFGRGCAA